MRVVAPARTWGSISEAARALDCTPAALYRYLEVAGGVYRLKPLDEAAYARWHVRTWGGQRVAPDSHRRRRAAAGLAALLRTARR